MFLNKSILKKGIFSLFLLSGIPTLHCINMISSKPGSTFSTTKDSSAENKKLIDYLRDSRKIIKSSRVETAMKQVDRRDFVRGVDSVRSYADTPQTISYNVTISAPHMHAYALELMKDALKPGCRCLDIGSGSGILLAYANRMGCDTAVGVEHIGPLVEWSLENLSKNFKEELESSKIVVVEGDGRKGYPKYAPYDCIHVGAAAAQIPDDLLEQLGPGGVMMIPYGPDGGHQEIILVKKDKDGKVKHESLFGVRYVPLTSRESQCPSLYKK